jgi:hypothetical protein
MRHSVSTKILQDVINYMASRPYTEVAALIEAIQKDATAVVEQSKEEVPSEN